MRNILNVFCFMLSFLYQNACAQEHVKYKNRVSLVVGHSYLILEDKEVLAIPSFGLDYEYWISEKWGFGVFSDIELITNRIISSNDLLFERHYPIVLTFDAIWNPIEHFEFVVGPGIEFEKEEVSKLIRFGVEFDLPLKNHWDVAPTIIFDKKIEGDVILSFGIGIGKRF